jgi:hypothetical protein
MAWPRLPATGGRELGGVPADFKVAPTGRSPYFTAMSLITKEMERELESLDPEDAQNIERALREMIAMARRKRAVANPPASNPRYEITARPLGLKPGLSYDNIGELLAQVEGEDWK